MGSIKFFEDVKWFIPLQTSKKLRACIVRLSGIFILLISSFTPVSGQSVQNNTSGTTSMNLDQCIAYGLQHQPYIQQSLINQKIVKSTNIINLSAWLPQLSASGTYTHYFQTPSQFTANTSGSGTPSAITRSPINNEFFPELYVSQTIYSPEVVSAAKNAHLFVQQAEQSLDSTKINVIVNISTAYYNLLLTLQQIGVLKEDTTRLGKTLHDTFYQYKGGIVDQTDYKEAYISLNNSKAQLRQSVENVKPQYSILKQIMGFPVKDNFNVVLDTIAMLKQLSIDTTQVFKSENRIEYKLLQTTKALQKNTISYYKSQFFPTLSANSAYILQYEGNGSSNFLSNPYPYSYIGLTFNLPLFTGFKRTESIVKARLELQQLDLAEYTMESVFYTQYQTALAGYKSNLYEMKLLKENEDMAKDVYGVVTLQYRQGIVPYLNVISAETNLMSSEINYLNAMFQVLISKVNLEKSMGILSINQ
jgi:outer membrane protein TolC